MPDLSDLIEQAAAEPLEAQTDAGRIKQRTLNELIDADQHLAEKAAASGRRRGLRFTKLVPPGAT